jgi:hypothetical protein
MTIRRHRFSINPGLPVLASIGLLFVATQLQAAEPAPVANSKSTTPKGSKSIHAFVRIPAVYAVQYGKEFDGRQVYTFDANRRAFLPKLSGGFGVGASAGVLIENVLRPLGVAAALNLEITRHQAISYNIGNYWYEHEHAGHYNLGLELREFLEFAQFRPFVAITPGYAWLSLPQGITVVDPVSRNTTWSDVTLRGFSFEAMLGLLYQFTPLIAADASLGYRLNSYTASSAGSLSGFGLSPGWNASLGLILTF